MTSESRKIRRRGQDSKLGAWARDLRARGYNIRYAAQVRDAAYNLFVQVNRDSLEKRGMSAEDVFGAGFDAGLRSIEYVNQDAARRGEPQELVREAHEHWAEVQRRAPFVLGGKDE